MKRLFGAYAYSEGPRAGCWWDQSCEMPARAPLSATGHTDVAIIGAGFTGLSAALHLAQAGVSVTVLEAQSVGWGASGRNGGFCCLGGGMLEDAALDRRVGHAGRIAYRRTELAAIGLVDKLLSAHGIEVDRHSDGEVSLAHRSSDMDGPPRQSRRNRRELRRRAHTASSSPNWQGMEWQARFTAR